MFERKGKVGHTYLGNERPGGVIVDGDEVDEEGSAADEGGEEEGRHQHLSDPNLEATLSYICNASLICPS